MAGDINQRAFDAVVRAEAFERLPFLRPRLRRRLHFDEFVAVLGDEVREVVREVDPGSSFERHVEVTGKRDTAFERAVVHPLSGKPAADFGRRLAAHGSMGDWVFGPHHPAAMGACMAHKRQE